MLDACRNNPFPADAKIVLQPGAPPVAIGGTGLGATRGAAALEPSSSSAASDDSLGTVIAFAAEPGRVALDGEPGDNSPYAAAVLRHLSAMSGQEFGTVMRMVAEEVYLKTQGRQRPWINESMRRLLYFGEAAPDPTGAEGDILTERRQLLITIAALPDPERKAIETVASQNGVPMDAVYGMLKALGAEAPKDPAQLEKVLRDQTASIKALQAERAVLKSKDPEIARLTALADQASAEGALATAISLHEQAKARVQEIEGAVEQVEADAKARRIEFADVYAASAQSNFAAFRFEQAAADYEKAYHQVERWDDYLTWVYRANQGKALQSAGWKGGKTALLGPALDIAREIVALAAKLDDRWNLTMSQAFLGNTLVTYGQRLDDVEMLEEAQKVYEAALEDLPEGSVVSKTSYDGGQDSLSRADMLYNLAGTLTQIGILRNDPAIRKEAIARFAELTDLLPPDIDPIGWARAATNQAVALDDLGRAQSDLGMVEQAAALLDAIRERVTASISKDAWLEATLRLAVAKSDIGILRKDPESLRAAAALFDEGLPQLNRASGAVDWAWHHANAATNLQQLGNMANEPAALEKAIGLFQQSLEVRTQDNLRQDWIYSISGEAGALSDLARLRGDAAKMEESNTIYRTLLASLTPEGDRDEWLRASTIVADNTRFIADKQVSLAKLKEAAQLQASVWPHTAAVADQELLNRIGGTSQRIAMTAGEMKDPPAALAIMDAVLAPIPGSATTYRANIEAERGRILYSIAAATQDPAIMDQAIAAYRSAIVPGVEENWANVRSNLALALREKSRMSGQPDQRVEAVEAWEAAQKDETRPKVWENNQRNLASLLDEIGSDAGSSGKNADAFAFYQRSASAWLTLRDRLPRDASPQMRGDAAENGAIALHNAIFYAPTPDKALLDRAIASYQAAAGILRPPGVELARIAPPLADGWLRVTENRADLELSNGVQSSDQDRLGAAAVAYRELEIAAASRTANAGLLPRVQAKRAHAESVLAGLRSDNALMAQSIALFRTALGPDMAKAAAADRIAVGNFANALRQQGYNTGDAALAQQAVDAAAAILALPPDQLGDADRASASWALADALYSLGDKGHDSAVLAKAVASYRVVEAFFTPQAYPAVAPNARAALANGLLKLGEVAKDRAALTEGATIYRSLLNQSQRETNPVGWATYANSLAYAAALQARAGDREADLAQAAALGRGAVEAFRAAGMQVESGMAEDTLCSALAEQGQIERNANIVTEALAACDRALAIYRDHKRADMIAITENTRKTAADLLSGLKGSAQ